MHMLPSTCACASCVDVVKATGKQFVLLTRDGRGALPALKEDDWGKQKSKCLATQHKLLIPDACTTCTSAGRDSERCSQIWSG